MLRTFAEHSVRPAMSLDGLWDFVVADDRKDRGRLPKKYTRTIHVPSAWEQMPGLEAYRGKGWYRTMIPAVAGMAARLVFGGVSHTATVFVDGKNARSHYDAYTPWDVVVAGLAGGGHELVVSVDNSFGPASALHRQSDYYTYGGVTRPVELQLVPQVYIDKLMAEPVRRRGGWDLRFRVRLKNWGKTNARRRVVVTLGDQAELGLREVAVPPGGSVVAGGTLKNLDVAPWSEHAPNLYDLEALLVEDDDIVDDLIDRIGFRQIKVRGRKLLLNGRPIRLRGYNRHEDHPQFGCAIPTEAMMTDLQIMKDLSCNFVRTSHYPNDMRFLDLCDEMGFYVWEESHYRNVPLDHPKFREQTEAVTVEMIEWHHNHPSIITWGCLNEADNTSPFGQKQHAWLLRLMRDLDGSRPVTYASNRGKDDKCMRHADIVSWNRYDAWYGGEPRDIEPRLKDMLKWLHSDASRGGRGKPVIMSEFGGGAIYGWRHPHRAKWTEQYQRDLLDESLRVYLNRPEVVGVAIWQFCDCRITPGKERAFWPSRPRSMNNKGTVDEYRRAKLAYQTVRKRMREATRRWEKAIGKTRS